MVAMEGFDHLLNWKLKRGSHYFPGPDGGTCINEAALVAAGFEYKPIVGIEQMPECFSRPICSFAMVLNDLASDEDRQRLLPYVMRLACADTPEVEKARAAYIQRHMGRYFVGILLFGVAAFSFDRGLMALEGALAIGRQADPLGAEEVRTRMDAARADRRGPTRAAAPAPVSDKPFFSKVKSWLAVETQPTA
jgi:hypothetical protein